MYPRAHKARPQDEATRWDNIQTQEDQVFRADGTVAPENGQRIGRYEVVGKVGSGTMGQVYRAVDPELQRQVAIKVHSLHPGKGGSISDLRARLLYEGRTLACISDPNVVAVYDVGLFRGQVFVAMELIAGPDLKQWIDSQQRSTRQIVETYLGAAAGLAAAHRAGVIHRDVKPANIVLGSDGRVRVLDFGLARTYNAAPRAAASGLSPANQLTHAGRVMGTPAYISPEQLAGLQVDARSDQFSFCVALWEALSGMLPFAAPTLEKRAAAIEAGLVQGRDQIPRALREVLIRGLRADPNRRHRSMEALTHQLRSALGRPRRYALGALAAASIVGLVLAFAALGDARSAKASEPSRPSTSMALSTPDQNSFQEQTLLAESRARVALLDADYEKAELLARQGLAALAHDELLHPSIGWSLMTTQATALRALGENDKGNRIFASVFAQIPTDPDTRTTRFLMHFAQERVSLGHMDEARLALAKLEHSNTLAPAVAQKLRVLAAQLSRQ